MRSIDISAPKIGIPERFRCGANPEVSRELPGRCLFSNHCLCIKLLGLPEGSEVSGCFSKCAGMLMVSHGTLEMRTGTGRACLTEGDSLKLPLREPTELWPGQATDILLFEKKD